MKRFRLLLIAGGAVVALTIAAAAVAFNGSFQTWAARKALVGRPELGASVGGVSAGLRTVVVKDLRWTHEGRVLAMPLLEVELPVWSAAMRDKVLVSRLVAKGWTLDLSQPAPAPGGAAGPAAADPAAVAAQAFAGILSLLALPFDLSLDGVQLEGEVILPNGVGRSNVVLSGGGLAAGREGKFSLRAEAALTGRDVSALRVDGTLTALLGTPRKFTRVESTIEAAATGAKFPQGVRLRGDFGAAGDANGELYLVRIQGDRPLITLDAIYPFAARRLSGTWKLDVRDGDLSPFALGLPMPVFSAEGAGRFDTDPNFSSVQANGRITVAADRLEAIKPELGAIGATTLAADFDLAQHGEAVKIDRLSATLGGAQPIATVQALQAFTLDLGTRRLQVADASRELLNIALHRVPVAWLQPFLPGLALTGDGLRGELAATAGLGGISLRSKGPLGVGALSLAHDGQPLVRDVALSWRLSADYAPQGWQAEIAGLTVKSGEASLLAADAKAGRLAGDKQPLKTTGKILANLPALLAQPMAHGLAGLARGDATVEFAASLGAKQEVQAKVALANLAADPKLTTETLPAISAEVRADIAADGKIALRAPIALEREGRKSDLDVAGSVTLGKAGATLDAQVTSTHLVVDDTKIFAVLLPPDAGAAKDAPSSGTKPATPPWAGVSGTLALALKKVIYSGTFQASDVTGTLRIDGGALRLEKMRAGLGEHGSAKLEGKVTFDAKSPQPYGLAADFALADFDPAPLFRALDPGQPPTVEGRFNVTSKFAGRALTLAELPAAVTGDFQLLSHSGVFRGLPVNVAAKLETTSALAAGIARLGSLASALGGKSDRNLENVASRAQAVSELVNFWKAIAYDQLSMVVTRDAARNTVLKDFTLISPELRLAGSGRATSQPGAPLFDSTLAMEFTLRARGRNAELLKYLGALDATTDDLGYSACTLPLKVGGTLGKPETGELNQRLVAIAMEKTGVGDKAAELFNRILGK